MRITVNILHRSGIGIIIFLSALVMWAAVRQKNTAGSANNLVAHAQSVLFQSEKMFTAVTDIETNSRAYVLTGEPYFLELYSISKNKMALTEDTLKKQIPIGSPLRTRIVFMLNIISKRIDFSDSLIQLKNNNNILSPI
ncbi:MAG: CHASE3 domain-containing protein, partial [Ferruginibacter sp.]|nr:CHASE3 domain-containing protein [Ferruginibacter sp.]